MVYHRAKFNKRVQNEGEPIKQFITDLHTLVKPCNYGTLEDEMIRDRIIVGMINQSLSEALQLDADITLAKVIERSTMAEEIKIQQSTVRDSQLKSVDAISRPQKPRGRQDKDYKKQRFNRQACRKCGKQPAHPFKECPAMNSTCKICNKPNHWAVVCRNNQVSKNLREIKVMQVDQVTSKPWEVMLPINNTPVTWKMDSGADVSVVGENILQQISPKPEMQIVQINLAGPGQAKLSIRGMFEADLRHKDKVLKEKIYVITGQQEPLLSRSAMKQLDLVMLLMEVNQLKPEDEFPEVFQGLGLMKGEYHIKLKEGAIPYSAPTSRRIPIPLYEKTEKKLQEMVKEGIIEQVTEPTEWCAPFVPRLKPDGEVRPCVDYSQLNSSIEREKYQLRSGDECMAKIGNAAVFSKLDALNSYFQVMLSKESRHLTTFITPFGRYCFKRMPMGLTSSSEHYQARMTRILEGLKGVVNMMDDILVFGNSVEEHDQNLRKALQALKAGGVTLNKRKCIFRTKECQFLGCKIVAGSGIKPDDIKVAAIAQMPKPKDVTALRSFIGSVGYHLKFLPDLSKILKPLRDLITEDNLEKWGDEHTKTFERV